MYWIGKGEDEGWLLELNEDSDNASNDSDVDFVLQKSLFCFKQFSIVRTSDGFSIRDILH